MKRIPEQPDRENRIAFEIVVDAYDAAERAMGWYYYLQDQLQVPVSSLDVTAGSRRRGRSRRPGK
nr:calcium-binding protein [Polaromonas glacialis]